MQEVVAHILPLKRMPGTLVLSLLPLFILVDSGDGLRRIRLYLACRGGEMNPIVMHGVVHTDHFCCTLRR